MRRNSAVLGLLSALLFSGCNLQPDVGSTLGVPYRSQEQFNYCTPASVLMWRRYDGLPEVSQTTIFNWMGGTGSTNQIRVAQAVNAFTYTRDAYWDNAPSSDYKSMAARQITAFSTGTPSIVVVRYDHTGVINGGQYHVQGQYKV